MIFPGFFEFSQKRPKMSKPTRFWVRVDRKKTGIFLIDFFAFFPDFSHFFTFFLNFLGKCRNLRFPKMTVFRCFSGSTGFPRFFVKNAVFRVETAKWSKLTFYAKIGCGKKQVFCRKIKKIRALLENGSLLRGTSKN